ncbi:cell division protein FtsI (penicillin-binding protein 3) [Allocatelliglobosispora scoriae]|uniref:Cell division protein FtsI (Penicillin-binding protein 3) n=1 Tax=Allocatelliglobosispora scoriae TaxID=643052 RepID=A0A841BM69_9ACTN|nr:penicillin-binding protein 2 [Allocatelliglobosispora scoriae]MBB5869374.1 cell division protein FtsI (penicillin-binding protein 3) [Allocatelliglobosispora scoriae]
MPRRPDEPDDPRQARRPGAGRGTSSSRTGGENPRADGENSKGTGDKSRGSTDRAPEQPRRGGLGAARAYTPRGRTTREPQRERDAATREPRPELKVVTGGRAGADRDRRAPRGRGDRAPRPPREPEPIVDLGPPPLGDPRRRIRLASALVLLMLVMVGLRLMQLQVTGDPALAAQGLKDRTRVEELPAPRGQILDRNGAVLARSVEARSIFADPCLIQEAKLDPATVAGQLAPLLGRPASVLLPLLSPHQQPDGSGPTCFEWLAHGLKLATGDAVNSLAIRGVVVTRGESRDVPGRDLAANIIGFTGEELNGLAGLEARFDDKLAGVKGQRIYEVGQGAMLGEEIPGGFHSNTPAKPGSSLQLTIDRDLQYEVQRILTAKMAQAKATMGAAVVLDIASGEVLAQASWPTYDAGNPFASKQADRGDNMTNIVVDPGSVHKAIVMAAALEEGVITPGTPITVGPSIHVGGPKDKDYEDHAHPFAEGTKISVPAILAYSSNVGTIKIANELGAEKLYEYQRRFGLGTPTGISVPGEAAGLVQPPENWSGTSYGSIPIGLGVSTTPIQMAAVYAAIANGGVWVQPHLVREFISPPPGNTVTPAAPPTTRRVISEEHAAQLRTMLEAVTTVKDATGRSGAIPGYRVAAKTGTGQLVVNGKYAPGEVASFIGMAPADAPRYVVAVFAHTPGGGGGLICGPAFKAMMEFSLKHFRVPPTGTKPPTFQLTY